MQPQHGVIFRIDDSESDEEAIARPYPDGKGKPQTIIVLNPNDRYL
ncbi:MAG: hypothetical protein ABL933_04875 [Methyloglobulus sp.]|nr:hypothetical protein [Methyloglobulus sp.]